MKFSFILKSLIVLIFTLTVSALAYKQLTGINTVSVAPGEKNENSELAKKKAPKQKTVAATMNSAAQTPDPSSILQGILTLKDIVPAEGDYEASAYIQYHGGNPVYFLTGDSVFNIAKLDDIQSDHVTVSYQGQTVKLTLSVEENSPGEFVTNDESKDNVSNNGLNNNVTIAEQAALISSRLRDQNNKIQNKVSIRHERSFKYTEYAQDLLNEEREKSLIEMTNEAWGFIQYEPVELEENIAGIKLTGVGVESGFLNKHGLEPGDVILSMDGVSLDNEDAITKGMNNLGEGKAVELMVERGSQKEIIIINKQ